MLLGTQFSHVASKLGTRVDVTTLQTATCNVRAPGAHRHTNRKLVMAHVGADSIQQSHDYT